MWKEGICLESTSGNVRSTVKTLPRPPPSSLQPPPLVLLVWADRPSSGAGNPSPWTCDYKDNISKNGTHMKTAHHNQVVLHPRGL